MKKLAELVRAAIGFDETRGDVLTVENLPFEIGPVDDQKEALGRFLTRCDLSDCHDPNCAVVESRFGIRSAAMVYETREVLRAASVAGRSGFRRRSRGPFRRWGRLREHPPRDEPLAHRPEVRRHPVEE